MDKWNWFGLMLIFGSLAWLTLNIFCTMILLNLGDYANEHLMIVNLILDVDQVEQVFSMEWNKGCVAT